VPAPVKKGEPIGKVVVTASDMAPAEAALIAGANVDRMARSAALRWRGASDLEPIALSASSRHPVHCRGARPLHHDRGRGGGRQVHPARLAGDGVEPRRHRGAAHP